MGGRVGVTASLGEYKGKHANLDTAFDQLRQYALALENPPLLIVSDMRRFRIRTNWTNSVSKTLEFELDAMIVQLKAADIEVSHDSEMEGIGRLARIHDPEGNAIELWEPGA